LRHVPVSGGLTPSGGGIRHRAFALSYRKPRSSRLKSLLLPVLRTKPWNKPIREKIRKKMKKIGLYILTQEEYLTYVSREKRYGPDGFDISRGKPVLADFLITIIRSGELYDSARIRE
jgi:hypothetical protein